MAATSTGTNYTNTDAAVRACPFLRSITASTNFNLSGVPEDLGQVEKSGPIFADGPNFELAFNLFHGSNGVVPLCRGGGVAVSDDACDEIQSFVSMLGPKKAGGTSGQPGYAVKAYKNSGCNIGTSPDADEFATQEQSGSCPIRSALTASAGSISLSAFGAGGFFGFDAFQDAMKARQEKDKKAERQRREEQLREEQLKKDDQQDSAHKAYGSEWLATGNCPIARSYRVLSRLLPAAAAAFKPREGIKYVCPPAIVAMRAAVAKHPSMRALRPQALPVRVLAIGTIGLFLNMPLGAWREHLEKFSPQWILVVHASVPFVAILRKAALMPKYAMAFTVASSIMGQMIGSKWEKHRLAHLRQKCSSDYKKSRELGRGLEGLGVAGEVHGECHDALELLSGSCPVLPARCKTTESDGQQEAMLGPSLSSPVLAPHEQPLALAGTCPQRACGAGQTWQCADMSMMRPLPGVLKSIEQLHGSELQSGYLGSPMRQPGRSVVQVVA